MIVVTWNVHGGVSETGVGIDLASTIGSLTPDLVALQEFPMSNEDELRKVAEGLNLEYFAQWHIEPSDGTGLALLSRWPMRTIRRVSAAPPTRANLRENANIKAHKKGALTAEIGRAAEPLLFASVHLFPFHLLDMPETNQRAHSIWADLSTRIAARSALPLVIAGDFNGPVSLRTSRRAGGLTSCLGDVPTRPDGRSHDDVLVSSGWVAVEGGTRASLSDHHLCWARLERGT